MINFNEYKITSKAVYSMDYYDFERMVKKELASLVECPDLENYDFVASIECGNDSCHEFGSDTLYFKEQDEIDFLEKIKKGIFHTHTSTIVDFLMFKEVIPKGLYVIDVCW